ncbi:hypothetical protein KRR38_07065 [Novosphingobium sp. G106]|uniref:D-Ala-D-Ala carboxypeptidase family metallohydrolase n=1 Tax=Novosphingobium sp. G106 TaxID=2849500 RepID=UPI001C2D121D|nr:D-Ala-D-Ala carboxypeptidase family metallohydrolase [Novosphingobium sp. G106]MBV1687442.1 hypothetical protein [Novosphingobium sp. G106]
MAREPNFYYQDPTAAISTSVARAIFGDPAMAQAQAKARTEAALREAQTREAEAHGRLYGSQATGQDTQNTAGASLPEMFRAFAASRAPAPPPPTVASPGFENFDAPMPEPEARPDPTSSLANLIATIGQMNGKDADPTKLMGSYGAFGGDDELARRGLVAQGHTPTKDFAITPERADEIAATDAAAKQKQAWGVADRNHATDIPVANIRASASRYGSDQSAAASRYATDGRTGTANFKAGGAAPSFDAIKKVFPNATMNSGWRSVEHNREVGGVANSTHLGLTPGVQGYDLPVQPGLTVERAAALIEEGNPGVRVVEARDETGRKGPNGKPLGGWHFALAHDASYAAPAKPAAGKGAAPKQVAGKNLADLDQQLNIVLAGRGLGTLNEDKTLTGGLDPIAKNRMRSEAIRRFQQSGNPVEAAMGAFDEFARRGRAKRLSQPQPAPAGDNQRVSPEAAAKLPKGTRFIGMDGVERIRQ